MKIRTWFPALLVGITMAFAALAPTPASADPLSTVSTPSGQCLTAAVNGLGDPVTAPACDPPDATQNWVFTTDSHLRIPNSNRYITAGAGGAAEVGSLAQAITWTYANHTLTTADGKSLTLCSGGEPYVTASPPSGCNISWYIFTMGSRPTSLMQELTHARSGHLPPLLGTDIDTCSINNFCGFLNYQNGTGYAASPKPGQGTVGSGVYAVGDDQGAWRVQVYADSFCNSAGTVTDTCPYTGNAYAQNEFQEGKYIWNITLFANQNIFYKDNSNTLDLATSNLSARDQMWVAQESAGGYLFNVSATDANSFGNPQPMTDPGGGAQLITCDISCEPQGRQQAYLTVGTAPRSSLKQFKLAAYMTSASCSMNVTVTHGTGTTDADIDRNCLEKVRAWEQFAGSPKTQYGPWKTSGDSIAWLNTSVSPDTGGYQRMQVNGTIHTITTF